MKEMNKKPGLYSKYTAKELWTDEHRAKQMLKFHLNEEIDISSNRKSYIEEAIAFMVETFKLDKNKNIIDFGCGPGLYTNRLAKFTNVTGVDFSENSLNYAKRIANEQGVNVEYIFGDYLEAKFDKKYDLVTMIMYDICALSKEQRKTMFIKFKNILKEGGKIFFDVFSHNKFNKIVEQSKCEHLELNGFWSEKDYYAYVDTFKYEEEKVALDKYKIVEEKNSYEVYNWLKYYSTDEIEKELEECGLKVERYYSDMTGKPFSENSDTFAIIASV